MILVLVTIAFCATGVFAAVGPSILFDWYMREVRQLGVAQDPAEAVITYPLA
jgi:hypothetical protein